MNISIFQSLIQFREHDGVLFDLLRSQKQSVQVSSNRNQTHSPFRVYRYNFPRKTWKLFCVFVRSIMIRRSCRPFTTQSNRQAAWNYAYCILFLIFVLQYKVNRLSTNFRAKKVLFPKALGKRWSSSRNFSRIWQKNVFGEKLFWHLVNFILYYKYTGTYENTVQM